MGWRPTDHFGHIRGKFKVAFGNLTIHERRMLFWQINKRDLTGTITIRLLLKPALQEIRVEIAHPLDLSGTDGRLYDFDDA